MEPRKWSLIGTLFLFITISYAANIGNQDNEGIEMKAPCDCAGGECVNVDGKSVCQCKKGWGLVPVKTIITFYKTDPQYCKECECGADNNCTFSFVGLLNKLRKTCACKVGYEDKSGKCKATCNQNPCQNGGTCQVKGSDIQCKCKDAFTGDLCEKKVDLCSSEPCKNGGQCSVVSGKVKCNCQDRYYGTFCETDCDCAGGHCVEKNGKSVCLCKTGWGLVPATILDSQYCKECECGDDNNCTFTKVLLNPTKKCLCKVGYVEKDGKCVEDVYLPSTLSKTVATMGTTHNFYTPSAKEPINETTEVTRWVSLTSPSPETSTTSELLNVTDEVTSTVTQTLSTERNLCFINPCRNGGLCREEGGEIRCYCAPPFSGKFCEIDPCSEQPCQNGGTCFVVGNSFQCVCKDPFAGKICEADPCMWNPCKNGGICKNENGGAKCFCEGQFTGKFCESLSGTSETNGTFIFFAIMISLLVGILILFSCRMCQSFRICILRTK